MQKNPFKSWKMHSIVDLVPAAPPAYDRHAAAVVRQAAAVLVHGAAGVLVRRAAQKARSTKNVKKPQIVCDCHRYGLW